MSPKIYTLVTSPGQSEVELVETSGVNVTEGHWQQLARHIAQEESLKHYPAEVLRNRWLENRAAIVINNNRIISYISIVSVFVNGSRKKFEEALNLPADRLPSINLYESATGWTHLQWRRQGISFRLRRCLLSRFDRANGLTISVAAGLAASPVLARLNWRLVAWDDIPFVSSLIGVSTAGLRTSATVQGRHLPEGMVLYQGEHLDPNENTAHPWDEFCYFWVSDEGLAIKMNQNLATLLDGDLPRWKEAVISVLFTAPPESAWRPFLFEN